MASENLNKPIINLDIPGWTSKEKLMLLADYASKVPENGWIVEVGAFVGRSSYVLSKNAPDSATVTCIDPWSANRRPLKEFDSLLGKFSPIDTYSYFLWKKHTEECNNIESIRAWCPESFSFSYFSFSKKADLVFVDGGHEYEDVVSNINFWKKHIANNGVVIFDDYENRKWPGVTRAIDEFLNETNYDHFFKDDLVGITFKND